MSAPAPRSRSLVDLIARLSSRGHLAPGDRSIVRDRQITAAVHHDSRQISAGGIFVAIAGARQNGASFAAEAIKLGAAAIVAEPAEVERIAQELTASEVPLIAVSSARRALAECAAWWEGDPSEQLVVIGVTGTDGKTTTSTFLSTALSAVGMPTALVSTAIARVGGVQRLTPTHQTTPEAPELQALLREIRLVGDRAVVLETTSHGLALDRVGGISYAAGIVTTFGSDHLDLHGTLDAYRAAKLQLIARVRGSEASRAAGLEPLMVIRRADAALAPFVAAAAAARIRVVDFDVAVDGALLLDGTRHEVRLRMPGRINALNAAAALALVAAWGFPLEGAIAAVSEEPGPPGRSEFVEVGQPFKVIVDFAHTGPSLEAAIELARAAAGPEGRLLLVTGAAGERDPGRRPAIGRASTKADLVWVADEDPRGENPDLIAAAIQVAAAELLGAAVSERLTVQHDRRRAIAAAAAAARPGDVLLLAGKGHERTIERSGGDEPWDEVRVATEALAALGYPQRT